MWNWRGGKEVYTTVVFYQEKEKEKKKGTAINGTVFFKNHWKNYINDKTPKQKRAGEHAVKYYKMAEFFNSFFFLTPLQTLF